MAEAGELHFDILLLQPYLPELILSDYHLFQRRKKILAGHEFSTYDDIKATVDENGILNLDIEACHHRRNFQPIIRV